MEELKKLIIDLVEESSKITGEFEYLSCYEDEIDKETNFFELYDSVKADINDVDDNISRIISSVGFISEGKYFYTWAELEEIKKLYERITEKYCADDINKFLGLLHKEEHYNEDDDIIKYTVWGKLYNRDEEIHDVKSYLEETYNYFLEESKGQSY